MSRERSVKDLLSPYIDTAKRWGARDRLMRLEQLAAACEAYGGKAEVRQDPTFVHLLVPRTPGSTRWDEADVVRVFAHEEQRDTEDADPFTPLIVHKILGGEQEEFKIEPENDDGFAELLGEWTRLVPYTYFERDYES